MASKPIGSFLSYRKHSMGRFRPFSLKCWGLGLPRTYLPRGACTLDHSRPIPSLSVAIDIEEDGHHQDSPGPSWLSRRLRDLLMAAPSAIGITVGSEHRW